MEAVRSPETLEQHHGGTLVPTMGALHEGHLDLVRHAARHRRPVVVSVFVNPTQFGPAEDLARYPRDLASDVEKAASAGADVVFAPPEDLVYPRGVTVAVPPLPEVATRPELEDASRPTHFAGVCQVVARLFDLVRPSVAVFGEKDYQQLLVIRALVAAAGDRWPALSIEAVPTRREPDGLAMSSRNAFLDAGARRRAVGLFRALQSAHAAQHPETAEAIMHEVLEAHELDVEYAVVRDAESLLPVGSFERPTRGLIAARVAGVRLIDNGPLAIWR